MKSSVKKKLVTALVLVSIFTAMIPVHAEEIYTVMSGDVLWKIAESYGLTYQEIEVENNLKDPNLIFEGQQLVIPDNEITPAPTVATAPVEPTEPTAPMTPGVGGPPAGFGPAASVPGDTIIDTPEVIAEMEKARDLAGDDESLIITQVLQSRDVDENGVPSGPPGANTIEGSEEHTEPIQLFDNLYFVGGTEVGCFIFVTSEGYIMIDSGYSYMPEDYIIPDMEKLGLDPTLIKYILITHAGPDHIGGSSYFTENYGTQILQTRADLVSLEEELLHANTEGVSVGIEEDNMSLTLGDTTITIVETPRKVDGGGLSYIAPVFDNGEAHMWATYGNTGVVGTLEDKAVYRESVAKFIDYVKAYDVDVVISNHPFADGSLAKMEELSNRESGEANPFVYGEERVIRFFDVLDQCCVVLITREEAGLDETGTKLLDQEETTTDTTTGAPVGRPTTAPEVTEEQVEEAPSESLDTPEIVAALQIAIDLAGDDESLMMTQAQQCKSTTYRGEKVTLEPIQLFDNLYFIGTDNVGVFIFATTDGYIMIDSGYANYPEEIIIPGMEKLGMDPSEIKYILITHAGPDHVGGAEYFQENYGTRIVMSEEEWDGAGGGFTSAAQDIVAVDGDVLTLGDTSITMVSTQRRVDGGGFSYIAEVFDNGESHMWATYGNTNVVGTLDDIAVYKDAVANFLTYVDTYHVDVVISSHPFVDLSVNKMEELQNRQDGEANPFVVGEETARTFFEILAQSAEVMMLRQEAGLDETGTQLLSEVVVEPRGPRNGGN